jgi:excisionase family DNA binding protein
VTSARFRNNAGTFEYYSDMDRDNFYTVPEAAKVLDISKTRVRQLLRSGEIDGDRSGKVWEVSKQSLHSFRDSYEPKARAKDSETLPVNVREAIDEVKDLTFRLGRMEGRLELEAVARSTLEEQLKREQERADQERQERIQAQEEARKLREELEAARKPWYQRIFGR